MNKSVVALSVTTALFAGTTAYLAYELHQRDALTAALPADTAQTTGASAVATAGNAADNAASLAMHPTAPPPDSATHPAGVATVPESKGRDVQAEAVAGFARQFLSRYDDANQRPMLLEE